MYLWKYWRETRVACLVSVAAIGLLLMLVLHEQNVAISISGNSSGDPRLALLPIALIAQSFPLCFLAWVLGSYGVGRDLGERSGSYLFSRPRGRGFFVWRDWGFGMVELLVLTSLLNAVIGLQLYRVFGGVIHLQGGLFSTVSLALPLIVAANCAIAFLLAGLVFSLTYLSTVIVKHSKGLMLGAGVLVGYGVLKAVAAHYWPGLHLPDIFPTEYAVSAQGMTGFADHLGLSLVLRAAFLVAFPFAAQLILEKVDL